MEFLKERIVKKIPGIERFLVRRPDLDMEEGKYVDHYWQGLTEEMYFVRCGMNCRGEWEMPVDMPVVREVQLKPGEEEWIRLRVAMQSLLMVGREETSGMVVHELVQVARITLAHNRETGRCFFYVADENKVGKIWTSRAISKTELETIQHERKLAIVMDRAGDKNAIPGMTAAMAGMLVQNYGVGTLVDSLSQGETVGAAIRILKGDLGKD